MVGLPDVYEPYLANLLAGRRQACRRVVQEAIDSGTAVRDIYVGLFQRSMYEVGRLWESGRISVATEHLATAITEATMPLVYPAIFSAEHVGRSAVISCVANERHQIGGKMAADILELHGWDAHFLGANTPLDDLLRMIDDKQPEVVGLSLSVCFNMPRLADAVEAVRKRFPDQRILVGGHAFEWAPDAAGQVAPAEYVPSLETLERLAGARDDS